MLKTMGRTAEAWMAVFNLEAGLPFYRVQASVSDEAEVETVEAGHFYLAFAARIRTCQVWSRSLTRPSSLDRTPPQLSRSLPGPATGRAAGRAPDHRVAGRRADSPGAPTLAPGEALTLYAIIGHVSENCLIEARA